MHTSSAIHLVLVTDRHYLVMLAALLKSIESNHVSGEEICAHIVEKGLSIEDKQKIEASVCKEKISLNWISVQEAMPLGVQLPIDHTSFPLIVYMRLFIPYFLPESVQKVIFMDVDMLMEADISTLWYTPLNSHVIAAVQDPLLQTFGNTWGGIKNYTSLGFAADTPYFNSGLLIINVQKWRTEQLAKQVIDTINHNREFANYPDQYGLNVVLAKRWLQLDERWNYFSSGTLAAPYVIHFTQRKPFYRSYPHNEAYQQLFYTYLELTEFRNAQPIGEWKRLAKKASNIIQKVVLSF